MGILDEIEKMDEEESLKGVLKRLERLENENQQLLNEILRILKKKERAAKKKGRKDK